MPKKKPSKDTVVVAPNYNLQTTADLLNRAGFVSRPGQKPKSQSATKGPVEQDMCVATKRKAETEPAHSKPRTTSSQKKDDEDEKDKQKKKRHKK
jgi:hypothetical protein